MAGFGACHTVHMGGAVRAEIVERWRTGVAALRRWSPLPRPSRWMWAADAILAFVLVGCTLGTALRQGSSDVPVPPDLVPTPPPVPTPGTAPAAPLPSVGVAQHLETHVARILAKLRLRDRAQAVVVAYETGLITPGAGAPAAEPQTGSTSESVGGAATHNS
ncbi:hypothetical protein GCM10022206_82510 [Streptomyces chiangmaiensis]